MPYVFQFLLFELCDVATVVLITSGCFHVDTCCAPPQDIAQGPNMATPKRIEAESVAEATSPSSAPTIASTLADKQTSKAKWLRQRILLLFLLGSPCSALGLCPVVVRSMCRHVSNH